jgi:hypothetical protein
MAGAAGSGAGLRNRCDVRGNRIAKERDFILRAQVARLGSTLEAFSTRHPAGGIGGTLIFADRR